MTLRTVVTALAVVGCGCAFAGVERTFVGATGGEFGLAANWSGAALPGVGDTAVISDGLTVETWVPDLEGDEEPRSYKTYGSNDLENWEEVPQGQSGAYQFFKVSVELKR